MNKVTYVRKGISRKAKRRFKIICIVITVLAVLCLLFAFVGFPIIFMNSIELQRLLMFTNLNLPDKQSYYSKYELHPGVRNLYVSVKDKNSKAIISLGVWHLLPYILQKEVITESNFNFDEALKISNISVILYFHGTGEDRSSSFLKYDVFRYFFHVITFDYRNYGDSTDGELSEDAVVHDCIQLYEWLIQKTSAPIFLWGHSLGSALVTRTAAEINSKLAQPVGLILEAPFTSMRDELYVHPYGKIFAWLPWFEATVIKPLHKNGFIFNTSQHILSIKYPVMILNAQDDSVVPYELGVKLYEIARKRSIFNVTLYYQFPYNLGYDHNFIFKDSFLPYFINYFIYICIEA